MVRTIATAAATKEIRAELDVKAPAEAIEFLNLLVYGPPGAGKTYLAGTAQDHPRTSPVLIVDIEGGVTTLRHRKDIDVARARTIQDIIDIHNKLHASDGGGYGTVVLDSLTELQKLDMDSIMKEVHKARPDLDPDIPSMREWGKSSNRIRRIVRAYRDLPVNTIMTALVAEDRDNNNVLKFAPSLPGKLKSEVPGFMDIVGYYSTVQEDDEIQRKLQVLGTRRVIAKDRTSALGELVVNPTIPMMWEMITSTNSNEKASK